MKLYPLLLLALCGCASQQPKPEPLPALANDPHPIPECNDYRRTAGTDPVSVRLHNRCLAAKPGWKSAKPPVKNLPGYVYKPTYGGNRARSYKRSYSYRSWYPGTTRTRVYYDRNGQIGRITTGNRSTHYRYNRQGRIRSITRK